MYILIKSTAYKLYMFISKIVVHKSNILVLLCSAEQYCFRVLYTLPKIAMHLLQD